MRWEFTAFNETASALFIRYWVIADYTSTLHTPSSPEPLGTMSTTQAATGNATSTSQQHKRPDAKVTTSSGSDYIDRHTALLARVFATDPAITYMLSDLTPAKRAAYLPRYMHTLLRASMLNAGVFVEAADWSCGAVWMLPGKRVDNEFTIIQAGFLGLLWNLGLAGAKRMLVEFTGQDERIKKEFLVDVTSGERIKRFHYLWFVGTEEAARGRGLASHLIRLRQAVAKEDGLPIWLEATTAKSRDVYAKCGFETVGEINLGVGSHASTGLREKGGSGLVVYAMIWRPEWDGDRGEHVAAQQMKQVDDGEVFAGR